MPVLAYIEWVTYLEMMGNQKTTGNRDRWMQKSAKTWTQREREERRGMRFLNDGKKIQEHKQDFGKN